ncbi:hypothetical protein DWH56_004473, partial [Escherichia coli]|nr:hypothetical protein [Escherichia coli]
AESDLQPGTIDYERYRLTKAQADAQELKNAREEGLVLETELFTFILQRVAPVAVDDGMEALTCSFKIYGYDVAMLTLLGLQAGLYSPEIVVRQAYQVGNATSGQVETLQGMITSITPDARPATSQAEASVTVEMSLSYYRQAVDGVETICIIPEEFVRRINGVNVLSDLKKIIRV